VCCRLLFVCCVGDVVLLLFVCLFVLFVVVVCYCLLLFVVGVVCCCCLLLLFVVCCCCLLFVVVVVCCCLLFVVVVCCLFLLFAVVVLFTFFVLLQEASLNSMVLVGRNWYSYEIRARLDILCLLLSHLQPCTSLALVFVVHFPAFFVKLWTRPKKRIGRRNNGNNT